MRNLPLVSIIICTQNRAEALETYALNSILKLNYPKYEIIVVDDVSKDKTQEVLKKFKDKIKNLKIIKNKKARGLCYARNLGIKYSKGDLIAFTDDDCIVDENWVIELIKPFLADSNTMAVGGKIYVGNSKKIHNNKKQIFCGNICFRREVFNRFLFDTNLYFNKCSTHDETELLYRLKNKGLKLFYNDEAIVRHFKKPAAYRKNREFGGPLNKVYMYTKKINLIKYYLLLFATLLMKKTRKFNFFKKNKEIVSKFYQIRGLLTSKHKLLLKLPWIFYVLLLEIPLKAKIKGHIEGIKFKR